MTSIAQEPFTYIERVGEDREHFLQWQESHDQIMEALRCATGHIWFQAFCMLNHWSLEQFLQPWDPRATLAHWNNWVAEQDCVHVDYLTCKPMVHFTIPLHFPMIRNAGAVAQAAVGGGNDHLRLRRRRRSNWAGCNCSPCRCWCEQGH